MKNKKAVWWIAGLALVSLLLVSVGMGVQTILNSGFTRGPDQQFGDQNLKTAVALIELDKVRNGKYPARLSDIKFTGAWDAMPLASVTYVPNADRTAYFVEVQRGWVGKPHLEMPKEFWKGTGYDESLRPAK